MSQITAFLDELRTAMDARKAVLDACQDEDDIRLYDETKADENEIIVGIVEDFLYTKGWIPHAS